MSGALITFISRESEYAKARVGLIRPDGKGERYPAFAVPGQASWQFGPPFADGRRIIVHSVEDERTWEHRSYSHLWIWDSVTGELAEIATKGRPGDFLPVATILPGEERLVVNPIVEGKQIVATMNLDGTDVEWVTRPDQGFTYAIFANPDATRLAFHVAAAPNYHVVTTDIHGGGRTVVARDGAHLYFGPLWSPDGEWLLFQDCLSGTDPDHFRSDLCIARPDGSEMRAVTTGQSSWFAAAYGNPDSRSGGSNLPRWAPRRMVCTYFRLSPGATTAWKLQTNPTYDDHFNRDYDPAIARGGSRICVLDPFAGRVDEITPAVEHRWDMRANWSPDGSRIAFCRADVGGPAELWIMDADGTNARFLTRGMSGLGADHPAWL